MQKSFKTINHTWIGLNSNKCEQIQATVEIIPVAKIVRDKAVSSLKYFYDAFYSSVFSIPVILWFLVILNMFIVYKLKFANFKNIALNIFVTQQINKNNNIKDKYEDLKSFISSSYGAISIAAVSEIVMLIRSHNTVSSIFWMCATIALLGLVQICEIIMNCHYVDTQAKKKSCFICAIQYVSNQYSAKMKNKKFVNIFTKIIIGYGLCMGIVSFFSASLFQVEQSANLYIESGGSYDNIMATLGIGLSIIFLLSSVKQFKFSLSLNNRIVTPILLFFVSMMFLFLALNSQYILPVLSLAIEDITNSEAILQGVISGLVISFARYIYKKYDPEENELESSSYEDTNMRHATTMYSIESFFMMFLVVITGITFFILKNYQDAYFFGLNVKYFISIFLVFFAFSVILNEAIYSKALLMHILNLNKRLINWIIRILLLIGIWMGMFPETDLWVDISDHISIILLSINLLAFFFITRDTKNSIELYKESI